jgi:hypothetical protein
VLNDRWGSREDAVHTWAVLHTSNEVSALILETNGTYTRLTTTDIAVHFGLANKLNQYHPTPLQQQPNQNGTKARGRWFKQQCFCLPWRFLYNHRAGQLRSRRCFHRDLHRNPHCLFFNP